ncbi:MAG: hypothetical protein E6R04_06355 [Spirochaetes bacterium]|nr:MAG: hypothetical protein E6R04_06355 [Spirochaetota bacterium]
MARITQYTREATPTAVNAGRQATAQDMGGNQAGLYAQAEAARSTAQASDQAGEVAARIETKRRNRIDVINMARMTDSFYNDAFSEYNRTLSEQDIIDPATAEKFNETIRSKSAEILSTFQGSPDAKAKLESEIMNQASAFTRQMTAASMSAQRKFLLDKAGGKITSLAQQIPEDPTKFNEIMMQADAVISDFSPGLYAEDEEAMRRAARSQVSLSALNTYIDRGMYEEANELIDNNPAILESIEPGTQRRLLTDIDTGLKERKKTFDEVNKKRDLLRIGEEMTGQKVDPISALNFLMDANFKKPDQEIIQDVANIYKINPEDVPAEIVLKIKHPDLKLNSEEVDPNKDYGPGNKLTISGLNKKLSPVVLSAEQTRIQMQMMQASVEQARAGNKVAGQGAVTAFKKMLDPNSAVMEGEITMVAAAEGLAGRLDKMFDPGKPVSTEQLAELEAFADDFTKRLMESKKKRIDQILIESDSRGFRRIDIGLPETVYKDIFGTDVVGEIKPDAPAPAGLEKLSDDELQRMLDEMGGAQ